MAKGKASRHTFVPVQEVVRRSKDNMTRESMSFPSDVGTHSFNMAFKEYSFTGTNQQETTKFDITLPLPKELRDMYQVNFANKELGSMIGQLTETLVDFDSADAIDSLTTEFKAFSDTNESTEDKVAQASAMTGRAAQAPFVASLASKSKALKALTGAAATLGLNSVEDAIGVGTGTAVNPVEAAVLQGVSLRRHQFSWTLSPRNKDEGTTLHNIIKKLRKDMHPSFLGMDAGAEGNFMFKYPQAVDIMIDGDVEGDRFRFKPCVITEMNADYGAGGTAFFKETGAPVVTTLNLSFMEIDIITQEDFE